MQLNDIQRSLIKRNPVSVVCMYGVGVGKTRAISAISQEKILVICLPQQAADRIWENEMALWNKTCDVITIDKFKTRHNELPHYDTVIFDELHAFVSIDLNLKSKKGEKYIEMSGRFRAISEYIERTKPTRMYGATATPTKSLATVWGIYKLFTRDFSYLHGVPTSFYKMRDTFYLERPLSAWAKIYMPKYTKANKQLARDMLLSVGEFGEIPRIEPTDIRVDVELTKKQIEAVDSAVLDSMGQGKAVEMMRIHMAENLGATNKLDALSEIIFRHDNGVIVFARYTEQIREIVTHLSKSFSDTPIYVLTGQTSPKDRSSLLQRAQISPGIFVVQSSISAGWELPDYDVMIFASLSWSFVDYSQGRGRCDRAKNIKHNIYYHLVGGEIDEKVYEAVTITKQDFAPKN